MMYLGTALLLGLASSLHCVGMCGPLVLAVPGQGGPLAQLYYHGGRLLTYALLGGLFGLLGWGVAITGWQQQLSLGLGVALVLVAVAQLLQLQRHVRWGGRVTALLNKTFAKLWPLANKPWGLAALGAVNGLLPCGMVYLALAAALVMNEVLGSMAYMLLFGLGTLPLLVLLRVLRRRLALPRGRAVVQLATACLAVLLILRGMGLGIPYISPSLAAEGRQVTVHCH